MASARRSLPNLDLCERPKDERGRFDREKPGCFLHGPEENSGLAGFGPGAAAERKRVTATELMPARVGREHDANAVAVLRVAGVAINRNILAFGRINRNG
eukprot:scaffold324411_cov70-Cyclotella_meneghiniana.AAC.3